MNERNCYCDHVISPQSISIAQFHISLSLSSAFNNNNNVIEYIDGHVELFFFFFVCFYLGAIRLY